MTDRQTKLADKPVAADAPAVRRLSDIGGAQITGIDLAQPLRAVQKKAILAAFIDHHILIFPGQNLDDAAQLAFSREFGELEGHVRRLEPGVESPLVNLVTNLSADGAPTQKPATHGNYHWHTDKSYHAVPSLTTILHAIVFMSVANDRLHGRKVFESTGFKGFARERFVLHFCVFGPNAPDPYF